MKAGPVCWAAFPETISRESREVSGRVLVSGEVYFVCHSTSTTSLYRTKLSLMCHISRALRLACRVSTTTPSHRLSSHLWTLSTCVENSCVCVATRGASRQHAGAGARGGGGARHIFSRTINEVFRSTPGRGVTGAHSTRGAPSASRDSLASPSRRVALTTWALGRQSTLMPQLTTSVGQLRGRCPAFARRSAGPSPPAWAHRRQSKETSRLWSLSSHHVLCLKPACEMADSAASSPRRSASVSSALKVPSGGRTSWILT